MVRGDVGVRKPVKPRHGARHGKCCTGKASVLGKKATGLLREGPQVFHLTSPETVPTSCPGPREQGRRSPMTRPSILYPALLVALAVVSVAAMLVGRAELTPELQQALLSLRGARWLAAFLAGAALSGGGVVVQGLFRNPLASPSILGTTAGATLGGQVGLLGAQLLGLGAAAEMVMPIGALGGALASLLLLLGLLRMTRDMLALLLTGFVLSSLFLAVGSFLTSLAQTDWGLGRAIVSFTLGGVSATGSTQVLFAFPLIAGGLLAAMAWGPSLDVMLAGEEEAASLGVDVEQLRWWTAVWVSVLIAGAVSLGGNVSFVGLVVPHALRRFTGAGHRHLLPAAALGGGAFLVGCDVLARLSPTQGELPLGVVTGFVGAPLFLLLLWRTRREHLG